MRVFAIQGVLARGFLDLNEIRNATDYKKEYDRSNGRPAFLVCCLDKPGTEAGGLATSPRGAADAQLPQVNYGLDRTVNLALGITQSGKPNSSKTEIDLGVCSSVDTEQLNTAVDEALHSLGLERPTAKSKVLMQVKEDLTTNVLRGTVDLERAWRANSDGSPVLDLAVYTKERQVGWTPHGQQRDPRDAESALKISLGRLVQAAWSARGYAQDGALMAHHTNDLFNKHRSRGVSPVVDKRQHRGFLRQQRLA